MKIRIKFSKLGAMKFIGHLDIMRYFQKAMRRSGVDIKYSEGFSPHQIMSFACPLGVGLTSNGEYMDIEVNTTKDSKTMIDKLNKVMVEDMEILSYRRLSDNRKNAMSSVAAADYSLTFRVGYKPENLNYFKEQLLIFASLECIQIQKKTKKSLKDIDIKPFIYSLSMKDDVIEMQLATGSANNLKPELVMEAFYQYIQMEYNEMIFQVQREDIYAEAEDSNKKILISLEALGEDIEE